MALYGYRHQVTRKEAEGRDEIFGCWRRADEIKFDVCNCVL